MLLEGFYDFVINENQKKVNDVLKDILNDLATIQPTDSKSLANDKIYKKVIEKIQRVHNGSYTKLKDDVKKKLQSYGVQLAILTDLKSKKKLPITIDQLIEQLKKSLEEIVKAEKSSKTVETPVDPAQKMDTKPEPSLAGQSAPLSAGMGDTPKPAIPEAPIQQGGVNGSWSG
jgi:DNA repair ATPase RecN